MSVSVSTTNKPLNPRAQDLSPKGYNRAALYSGKALDFDGVNDEAVDSLGAYIPNHTGTAQTSPVLLPQGLTANKDITGPNRPPPHLQPRFNGYGGIKKLQR
jgi:hypothetical protein